MTSQIFIWWLAAQAFGLVGLPLARFLFRALPDRGYAFSKTLGLLLTGYLAWLVAMLGLAPFGTALSVVCALAVGALGLLVARGRASGNWGAALKGWARANWRMVLGYELLFAAALVFVALLRSYNPTPWGTERPMDYALFNAIRRSASFPPHDPWLSGYSINYYYFGYMLMAIMALISGLAPSVAFNLSLALIFALTALGIAGVAFNLIVLTERTEPLDPRRHAKGVPSGPEGFKERPIALGPEGAGAEGQAPADAEQGDEPADADRGRRPGRPAAAGRLAAVALTVVLVLFAANQAGALEIITGADIAVALKGPQLAQAVANGLGPRQPLYLYPPFKAKGWDFDGTQVITPTNMLENFNWWWPSRVVWDDYRDPEDPSGQPMRRQTITEFPFFSFWLGDMHPHVMALPFALLALALALQTLARRAAAPFAMGRRGWLELALTGIVLGSLYAINSWDFPTYLLLFLGALLLLHVRLGTEPTEPRTGTRRVNREPGTESEEVLVGEATQGQSRASRNWAPAQQSSPAHPLTRSPLQGVWWRHYFGQALMVVLASVVLLSPFYLTFRSLVGDKEPLINVPILATITRTLGFVTSSRTEIYSFLLIFGLFLIPLVLYIVVQGLGGRATRQRGGEVMQFIATDPPVGRLDARAITWYLPWLLLATLALGSLIGFALLALLPLGIYAAWLGLRRVDQPATAFVLWAGALIFLVCFGTEIIYIRDSFEGASSRMNTIFKFYYQAWLIWGLLGGYTLWWLYTRIFSIGRPGGDLLGALFSVLLAGALLYPWLTAGKTFRQDERVGLSGQTPRENNPDEAAAIAWLRENAAGDATVLEAVGGSYSSEGFGGVSAATGLATVLGWPGHEDQWRGGDPAARGQIGPRQTDVQTLYTTTDVNQARELLKKYKVDYVYVGSLEHGAASPEALAKFSQLGEPVFQQGDVAIYRVTEQ
jgi:YYY domain-containing protein